MAIELTTQLEGSLKILALNGTLRERTKVQRGWKTPKSVLAEGNRIQYNFIKPHMALDGKTPSEASGIKLESEGDKWTALIKNAMRSRQEASTKIV